MAEYPIPFDPVGSENLPLRLLVSPRDAACVTLGAVHLFAPALGVELGGSFGLSVGALSRPAPPSVAVRVHRSSNRSALAFKDAYHLTTG